MLKYSIVYIPGFGCVIHDIYRGNGVVAGTAIPVIRSPYRPCIIFVFESGKDGHVYPETEPDM